MRKEKWYRKGDGRMFSVDEGSASDLLMTASGEFTEVVEVDGNWVEPVQETAETAEPAGDPDKSIETVKAPVKTKPAAKPRARAKAK